MNLLSGLKTVATAALVSFVLSGSAIAGDYVTVDKAQDVSLYYEEAGQGEQVVVFVPGWTLTSKLFKNQLAHFEGSENVRFIAYDPRAHGRSTKTLEGADYGTHAADLKAFIDELGLKNVVLGGWSWGGVTVYEYLAAYGSDNVAGVVLMDQTPHPFPVDENSWTDGGADVALGFFRAFVKDRKATMKDFIPWMFTAGVSDEDAAWVLAETMMTPKIVASQLLYDGYLVDHTKTIAEAKLPQLHFVRAEQAPFAEPFLRENVPAAEMVALGGHGMFYDHAGEFNSALDAFLAKLN